MSDVHHKLADDMLGIGVDETLRDHSIMCSSEEVADKIMEIIRFYSQHHNG